MIATLNTFLTSYAPLAIYITAALWAVIACVRALRNPRPNLEDDCLDEQGDWPWISGAGGGSDRLHNGNRGG